MAFQLRKEKGETSEERLPQFLKESSHLFRSITHATYTDFAGKIDSFIFNPFGFESNKSVFKKRVNEGLNNETQILEFKNSFTPENPQFESQLSRLVQSKPFDEQNGATGWIVYETEPKKLKSGISDLKFKSPNMYNMNLFYEESLGQNISTNKVGVAFNLTDGASQLLLDQHLCTKSDRLVLYIEPTQTGRHKYYIPILRQKKIIELTDPENDLRALGVTLPKIEFNQRKIEVTTSEKRYVLDPESFKAEEWAYRVSQGEFAFPISVTSL